ncbi:uncharacterized protein LOC128559931 isoform X2 [Mercenaria mercenaria]|uniref:uncharacterized protein LOC128559931 isoform X2 n=1 Tax=Mercenaria mercenaria TaxID=6596 RepID=UPI00234FA22F|nr:uncharacterized protein LOC128559931 isoform X2 [Mercenaria mercenaria]
MANIFLCLALGFLYMFTANAALPKSHYGKEFYIGMLAEDTWTPDFQIDIASKEMGNAYLDIPYLNIHRNQSLSKGDTTLMVSNTLIRGGTFTENRGIYLSADVPVAVYVTWKAISDVTDTYLALPLTSLGTRYTVASYDPCCGYKSGMMVIGAYDNTTVTITDRSNRNTSFSLKALHVHQLSSQTDISNMVIWSDKPVAAISGTSCANVPHHVGNCDMLLEQMIPSQSSWDTMFIVPPIFPKLGYLVKVFSVSNAKFCFKNVSTTLCNQSYKDEYLMGTGPVIITSNASISVVQYGVGQDYDQIPSDEFMTIIPGKGNYLNKYYFVIPRLYSSLTNRLSIVVPTTEAGGLRLDGSLLTSAKSYSVPDPFSNYTVLIINVTVGYHELNHIHTDVMFGATAYGLDTYIGYGFPVGFGFPLVNKPTTTPETVTTSDVHPVELTTSPTQMSKNVTCYSCDDLSYVELCDVVKHCDVNEICYLKSYMKFGRKLYRSGCMQPNMCLQEMDSYQYLPDKCVECCSDHYCNHKGCGDNGLVPRSQRGPLCYDCLYERSPEDCNKLALCEQNEFCSTEEFKWGDHSHFIMGCSDEQCSRSSRSVHVATRALPVCRSCCTDDYCNMNCTRSDVGSILVG